MLLAHAGHWLPQLLYLVPMLVMVAAAGLARLRGRRRGGDDPPPA